MNRKDRLVKELRKKKPVSLVLDCGEEQSTLAIAEGRTRWSDTAALVETYSWQRLVGVNADDQVVLNIGPDDLVDPDDPDNPDDPEPVDADEVLEEPPDLSGQGLQLGEHLRIQEFTVGLMERLARQLIAPIVGPITKGYTELIQMQQQTMVLLEKQNLQHMEMVAAFTTAGGGAPAARAPDPNDGMVGRIVGAGIDEYLKRNPNILGTLFGLVQGLAQGGEGPPADQGAGQPDQGGETPPAPEPATEGQGGNTDPRPEA